RARLRAGAGADHARAGPAVRAPAGLRPRPDAAPGPDRDLPALCRARGDLLAAAGLPLPPRHQPGPLPGRGRRRQPPGRAPAPAPLRRRARIGIFLPYAVPAVISSLLWGFLYLPGTSPVHFLAEAAGGSLPDVLSPQLVLLAIANIGIWGGTGFNMVVLYTSLR